MNSELEFLREEADRLQVREIANLLLDDPRFPIWSGSSKPFQHHYGTGGLLTHTSEVVSLCLTVKTHFYPRISRKILFLAALFHDWGKLWDYEIIDKELPLDDDRIDDFGRAWQSTLHKRNIHHISRSACEWVKAVATTGTCHDIEDEVTHAILSHHGERTRGSPVAPNSQVAWLLHLCDGISARMNDCDKNDYVKFRGNS